jgi:glycosyltransferase involved in cell wall biosynthesis
MPINKKIYKPKLVRLLALLGVDADLSRYDDALDSDDGLLACMEQHLPKTHLYYPYGRDYINLLAPILDYSDYVDFLSPGQLRFYSSFADTPFEQLYGQLTIAKVMERNADKLFVGWCAISDNWHRFDPSTVDRDAVLRGLGLDPALPTFYHNARYAVEHKGQVELMRAIDAVLGQGVRANFIVRCISGSGIDNPYFHEVKARYPDNIHLDWNMVSEATLMQLASAADFSLFPSKFEMDTFLIAQGESMLCGAVPIATAQEGTSHFQHALPLSDEGATGFSVNRSFCEDDPLLARALAQRITEAAVLYRDQPGRYHQLAANGRAVASRFTWQMAGEAHLEVFERAEAARLGRATPVPTQEEGTAATPRERFEQAWERADFDTCHALNREIGSADLADRLAGRITVRRNKDGHRVAYALPAAAGIELFARFGDEHVFAALPMTPEGERFEVALPGAPSDAELYFRLTLHSGRVCWDRSPYAAN